MTETSTTFLDLTLSKKVARSALKVSILVGTLLALINHGAAFVNMEFSTDRIAQVLLTYLVPYCVSTYSSVKAIQGHAEKIQD